MINLDAIVAQFGDRVGMRTRLVAMDQEERSNWEKIAAGLEAAGDTSSGFYQRARAIADGKPDPMGALPSLTEDS